MSKLYIIPTPIGNLKDITFYPLNINIYVYLKKNKNFFVIKPNISDYSILKCVSRLRNFESKIKKDKIFQDNLNKYEKETLLNLLHVSTSSALHLYYEIKEFDNFLIFNNNKWISTTDVMLAHRVLFLGNIEYLKKIDLLQVSLDKDNNIVYLDEILDIKSPIIEFCIEDYDNINPYMSLIINKYSILHNLYLNLLGYIERIYNINNVDVDLIEDGKIKIYIADDSKLFDKNTKIVNKGFFNSNIVYKGVISFNVLNGHNCLKQLVLIK